MRENPAMLAAIKETLAQRSHAGKAAWQLINSLGAYVALWVAMYFTVQVSWLLTLLLALLAAGVLVRVFIISHDCGRFVPRVGALAFWGVLTGPATFVLPPWRGEHAVHHGTCSNPDRRGRRRLDVDGRGVRGRVAAEEARVPVHPQLLRPALHRAALPLPRARAHPAEERAAARAVATWWTNGARRDRRRQVRDLRRVDLRDPPAGHHERRHAGVWPSTCSTSSRTPTGRRTPTGTSPRRLPGAHRPGLGPAVVLEHRLPPRPPPRPRCRTTTRALSRGHRGHGRSGARDHPVERDRVPALTCGTRRRTSSFLRQARAAMA